MVVMVLEKVPKSLRGELSRWLIELGPGVFVGQVSGLVRDLLWQKCEEGKAAGRCYQAFSTNTEQGFDLRCSEDVDRTVIHHEGLAFVAYKSAAWYRWRRFGEDAP